jgi:hypothetical protein
MVLVGSPKINQQTHSSTEQKELLLILFYLLLLALKTLENLVKSTAETNPLSGFNCPIIQVQDIYPKYLR